MLVDASICICYILLFKLYTNDIENASANTKQCVRLARCGLGKIKNYIFPGRVNCSHSVKRRMASSLLLPHISCDGRRLLQTAGRWSLPNMRQRLSPVSCMQRTPAGFPSSMAGIDDEMDGAIQQAAQPIRHSIWIHM